MKENGLMVLHSGGQKLDQVSEAEEIDKNLKLLVTNIPEKIRQEVLDRLMGPDRIYA